MITLKKLEKRLGEKHLLTVNLTAAVKCLKSADSDTLPRHYMRLLGVLDGLEMCEIITFDEQRILEHEVGEIYKARAEIVF